MSFARKTRKLIRNPAAFFRDSRHFKRIGRAPLPEQRVELDCQEIGPIPMRMAPREIPLSKKDLYRYLVDRLEIFLIPNALGRDSICTLAQNYLQCLEEIMRYAYQECMEVTYDHNGKLKRPASVRVMLDDLASKRAVKISLRDLRSQSTFYYQIEKWSEDENFITSPVENAFSRKVWKSSMARVGLLEKGRLVNLSEIFECAHEDEVTFDVDYVFSWVNSDDEEWQQLYLTHKFGPEKDGNSLSRYVNRDELKFSLRALEEFAPWVRKVHIVSNCKPPKWLDLAHTKINWVMHEKIFDAQFLPTFSSHAIEANLHKIPGLAKHFIYSNDDFMLSRPTLKTDFFEPNGLCKIKFERWGNVNGPVEDGHPDYLNGARNSNRLLERDFGASTTQLHCHAPQAMRVDILEEMEARYAEDFERTSSNKFRDKSDIAVTGYLFHHYAYLTGRGIKDRTKTLLIQQNHNFVRLYSELLEERESFDVQRRYLSFCVNDGADSHLNEKWNTETMLFLEKYFPEKSSFEI